jgi:hypothetical protein
LGKDASTRAPAAAGDQIVKDSHEDPCSSPSKIGGLIQHYTAALDANGPWFISGEWSVWAKGNSGTADFSVVLNMIRSVTSNGNLVFAAAPVEIQVTGGNAVPYSNASVRFTAGGAMSHFGAEPLTGVVTPER